mgnify:CR=1 FL=1
MVQFLDPRVQHCTRNVPKAGQKQVRGPISWHRTDAHGCTHGQTNTIFQTPLHNSPFGAITPAGQGWPLMDYCAGPSKRDRPTSIEHNCFSCETSRVFALILPGPILGPCTSALHGKRSKHCLILGHVPISLRTDARTDGLTNMNFWTSLHNSPFGAIMTDAISWGGAYRHFEFFRNPSRKVIGWGYLNLGPWS